MAYRLLYHLLLHCIITGAWVISVYAAGSAITVKAATVNLDFQSVIERYSVPLSQDDLRRLAMEITNLYHENGYTTSYAEKVIVKKNGDIEILVRESRIAAVTVLGVNNDYKQKIIKLLKPRQDELYNTITIKERAEYAVKSLQLSSMKINLTNIDGTADVNLKIDARSSSFGSAKMKLQYEPIYGLSPFIGYDQKFDEITITLSGNLGIKDSAYRKKFAQAMVSNSTADALSLYMTFEWSKTIETWSEELKDFTTMSRRPSFGIKYSLNRNILFDVATAMDYIVLENYQDSAKSFHDVSFCISGHYTDAPDIIVPGNDTKIGVFFSFTKSNLEEGKFINTRFFSHTVYTPISWIHIRPSLSGNYTAAEQRFYRGYAYDESFPVKNSYASTHARIMGNVYFEFEVYPEMIHLGPTWHQMFYYNETSYKVESSTAFGIRTSIVLGRFYINAICLSTIENMYSKPVFLFSASGVF